MPATTILAETLEVLIARNRGDGSRITAIRLTPYFTVIQVDESCVGAVMSYYRLPHAVQGDVESGLESVAARDPLLSDWLLRNKAPDLPLGRHADQLALLESAVMAALTSALSVPWLIVGGDSTFSVRSAGAVDPFAQVGRALVVGFGGYASVLAQAAHVRRLDICDLSYPRRREQMDRFAREHERRQPGKIITVSGGEDLTELMARADAIAITGSALANGTMDGLLARVPAGTPVIVQGQSAAIHPVALFQRGVHLVQTTLKPPELLALAGADTIGARMRGLLDGGSLPWIDLVRGPS